MGLLIAAGCLLAGTASAAPTPKQRLITAASAGDGRVVRLEFRRGQRVELVVGTRQPAHYLKERVPRVVRLVRHMPSIRLVVRDARGLVLLWAVRTGMNPIHGSLYVRPGLERCSPIVAIGWPSNLPPCPV